MSPISPIQPTKRRANTRSSTDNLVTRPTIKPVPGRLPVVAVAGRPNVGKSSLVNRIVGRRAAVVEHQPGVTRDRKEYPAEWVGVPFTIVDTGGWLAGGDALEAKVSAQAERAVAGADVVLFVVDVTVGATEEDMAAIRTVLRAGTPVLLVANKVDDTSREAAIWELLALGAGDPWPISALHGRGTGDLLDEVVRRLPAPEPVATPVAEADDDEANLVDIDDVDDADTDEDEVDDEDELDFTETEDGESDDPDDDTDDDDTDDEETEDELVGDEVDEDDIDGEEDIDEIDDELVGLPAEASPFGSSEVGSSVPRVALIGRPNVGKSTLFNRLCGEERSIVHDMPGTTRDAIDTVITTNDGPLCFVDTAGMRRPSRTDYGVESYATLRALEALDRADIALLLIDATVGATHQDQRLAERIGAAGCPAVIILNKWDLVETDDREDILGGVGDRLAFLGTAPVLRVSAASGRGVHRILPALHAAVSAYHSRIPTGALNRAIGEIQTAHPTHLSRIRYAVQGAIDPPTFTLFTSGKLTTSYLRYVERGLREHFDLGPTPIKLRVRIGGR